MRVLFINLNRGVLFCFIFHTLEILASVKTDVFLKEQTPIFFLLQLISLPVMKKYLLMIPRFSGQRNVLNRIWDVLQVTEVFVFCFVFFLSFRCTV